MLTEVEVHVHVCVHAYAVYSWFALPCLVDWVIHMCISTEADKIWLPYGLKHTFVFLPIFMDASRGAYLKNTKLVHYSQTTDNKEPSGTWDRRHSTGDGVAAGVIQNTLLWTAPSSPTHLRVFLHMLLPNRRYSCKKLKRDRWWSAPIVQVNVKCSKFHSCIVLHVCIQESNLGYIRTLYVDVHVPVDLFQFPHCIATYTYCRVHSLASDVSGQCWHARLWPGMWLVHDTHMQWGCLA